jgi:hypothetical protein
MDAASFVVCIGTTHVVTQYTTAFAIPVAVVVVVYVFHSQL